MQKGYNMRIKIENFAKIKKADIEINGITVIAGENNTGKSTIGKAIACTYNAFHDLKTKVNSERLKGIFSILFNYVSYEAMDSLYDETIKLINMESPSYDEVESIVSKLTDGKATGEKVNEVIEHLKFDYEELKLLFINKVFNEEFNSQIVSNIDKSEPAKIELHIKNECVRVEFDGNSVKSVQDIELYNDGIYINNPFLINDIRKRNVKNPHLLAIDIMFGRGDMYRLNDVLLNKLSESNNKGAESLIDEALYKKKVDNFLDIIKNTIKGDFVEKDDKFMFTDNDSNSEIELSNLSTGIKSFAIILKLIENKVINNKSMIVLDEPEVHLHPKWQLIYAEILILLQKEFDLSILLSTHSPYFINAIEAYSKKYNIVDNCKYYLAELDDKRAIFDDVTTNPDKIYKKLAEPFQTLANIEDNLDEDVEL